jgi:hypothetical protein
MVESIEEFRPELRHLRLRQRAYPARGWLCMAAGRANAAKYTSLRSGGLPMYEGHLLIKDDERVRVKLGTTHGRMLGGGHATIRYFSRYALSVFQEIRKVLRVAHAHVHHAWFSIATK